MSGPHRRTIERKESAALEDPVDDGLREVVVVQDGPPGREGLVGGEDHRPLALVAVVDDVKQHVRGVRPVRQVAHFIHDEDSGVRVGGQGRAEPPAAEGSRQGIDEFRGGHEARVEAILDGPIGERDGEMRFPAPRLARQDQIAALGDEVRGERGAEEREADRRLPREVEVVDGLEEGEAGAMRQASDASLLAVRDLFRQEEREEVTKRSRPGG